MYVKANSILESVIALSIISICLYFSILIFATVFSHRSSTKFYDTQNKVNEMFYLSQLKRDSLEYENEENDLIIEEENINEGINKISISLKDSLKMKFEKEFYVQKIE
jgi:hypothetical protein